MSLLCQTFSLSQPLINSIHFPNCCVINQPHTTDPNRGKHHDFTANTTLFVLSNRLLRDNLSRVRHYPLPTFLFPMHCALTFLPSLFFVLVFGIFVLLPPRDQCPRTLCDY